MVRYGLPMKVMFWMGVCVSVYSYLLYPLVLLLVLLLSRRKAIRRPLPQAWGLLPVTVIITARNEGARIRDKLENTLALEYPRELFSILVASDASTDDTDEIVGTYAGRHVELVRAQERKGKEYAQLCAIRRAGAPILVFTDAATRLESNALQLLVEHFSDPTIGAVSSRDELVGAAEDKGGGGEGAYVRYEMGLRAIESRAAGLVGLSGSCFAVRREVCERWRIDTPSDITVALLCAQAGMRAVSDERVKGAYLSIREESREFARKRRTIVRGMTAVWELRESLNPLRYGGFAFQVWSHKVFRWLVPVGMGLTLVASAALADSSPLYRIALLVQCAGYLAALMGWLSARLRGAAPVRIALYFVTVNLATAFALFDFLRGVRITTWNPSQR